MARRLQRAPRVTSVSAHCVLHTFYGALTGVQTAETTLTLRRVKILTYRLG